jgi:sugar phosphate isomerase/epimerase
MLDGLGLGVAGSHVRIDAIQGQELQETIEFAHALGNQYVVVPGLPGEYTESKTAWQRTADVFSEAAESLKGEGLKLGYHNHRAEFEAVHEGERAWDIFFEHASHDVFSQLDIGHTLRGGGDAVEALKKYPGRFATVHVKDYDPDDEGALVGEGVVPWEEVFALCESSAGTEWYIVEHEVYPYPPMECVRRCLENMREMGK